MTADEQTFSDEIDTKFPYDNKAEWRRLIDRGIAISPNAAFIVLHEICQPPLGTKVSRKQFAQMIEYWRLRFDHPIADLLLEVAGLVVRHERLPDEEAIRLIEVVAAYPNLYAALAIFESACDDADGVVRAARAAVVKKWEAST
jgi:hypothetical protein